METPGPPLPFWQQHKEKYGLVLNWVVIPIGFMFLQCTEGAEDAILRQIKSISGVAYAYKLEGSYDLVVKIESNTVEEFTHAIAAIRKVPSILNTDTIIGFK